MSAAIEGTSPAPKPMAGYMRVSRVGSREGEGYISPDEQREGILERARHLGVTVPEDAWFFDEDVTGGNFDNRARWFDLLALIESGELGGVIVVRVDRFARTVAEGAPMIQRIEKAGGLFAAVDVPMDTSTPEGRYLLNQFLNNAELQLNILNAGWTRSKARAIRRGAHIGRTPTGMGRVPKNALERSGTLYPLEEWKPVLTDLFTHAAAAPDDTTAQLSSWANARLPRPDGRRWTATGVGHVLANRVYLGEVAYRPREGRPQFDALENATAHEPIIDERTWLAAQRGPSRRPRQKAEKSKTAEPAILQGLLRCKGCRHTLVPSRGGKNIRTYRCDGEYSSGKCPNRVAISAHVVEPWVLAQVRDGFELQQRVAAASVQAVDPAHLDAAETRLSEARAKLTAISANVDLAADEPEAFKTAVRAARARVQECQEAYEELARSDSGSPTLLGASLDWDGLTPQELRDELLPALIDCVIVFPGRGIGPERRCRILWRGEADDDLPGKGRPAPEIRPFPHPRPGDDEPVLRVAGAEDA